MILLRICKNAYYGAEKEKVLHIFENFNVARNAASFVKLIIFNLFMGNWGNF